MDQTLFEITQCCERDSGALQRNSLMGCVRRYSSQSRFWMWSILSCVDTQDVAVFRQHVGMKCLVHAVNAFKI